MSRYENSIPAEVIPHVGDLVTIASVGELNGEKLLVYASEIGATVLDPGEFNSTAEMFQKMGNVAVKPVMANQRARLVGMVPVGEIAGVVSMLPEGTYGPLHPVNQHGRTFWPTQKVILDTP